MLSPFGPVLPFDLVRTARKGRYILLRSLYGLLLLALLYLNYAKHDLRAYARPQDLARFAESFFLLFLLAQILLVYLLTPAVVGDAVAEEKHRRTLDYLLTTQLTAREIVLGKLAARVASLLLFFLAGLPVLSLIQLFGGVSPELLWGGFAATLLTALAVAALSLWLSVLARQPRDAIVLAYLVLLSYFVVWGVLEMAHDLFFRRTPLQPYSAEALEAYNAGNPFRAFLDLERLTRQAGITYAQALPPILARYALFHGLLIVGCPLLAVWQLRPVFLAQTFGGDGAPARRRHAQEAGPYHTAAEPAPPSPPRGVGRPVGHRPMLWKELWAEPGFRFGRLGRVLIAILGLACLAPAGMILLNATTGQALARAMNNYARLATAVLGTVLLLGVAVRAAGSVSGERDRQTLDGLLASPLGLGDVLLAKWLGSIAAGRRLLYLLAGIWLLGVLTGGLAPLAVVVLVLALGVYAGFMASLGLVFSVTARTSLRAVTGTVVAAVVACAGPGLMLLLFQATQRGPGWGWVTGSLAVLLSGAYAAGLAALLLFLALWARKVVQPLLGRVLGPVLVFGLPAVCGLVALAMLTDAWRGRDLAESLAAGMTPPAVLAIAAFRPEDFGRGSHQELVLLICSHLGLGAFTLAAMLLGYAAFDRFRKYGGRIDGPLGAACARR